MAHLWRGGGAASSPGKRVDTREITLEIFSALPVDYEGLSFSSGSLEFMLGSPMLKSRMMADTDSNMALFGSWIAKDLDHRTNPR